jgi:hypothetical protein
MRWIERSSVKRVEPLSFLAVLSGEVRVRERLLTPALALALLVVTATGCGRGDSSVEPSAGHPDFFLGGIQVNEPDHERWIETLREEGLNTVAVTVYAHQGDWDSDNLWFDDEAPWVVNEIRVARQRGMGVVLVLRVALDHAFERNKFLWHGMIMPRTDEQLSEWFRRYSFFVAKWARVAEEEGVSVLAVGSEMNALTNAVPIDELPVLEEYWTNEEKVERERTKVMAHADEIQGAPLEVRGNDSYGEVGAFLDDQNRAHVEWARQTTWRGAEDALGRVNRRRELLEQHWRELIAAARAEYSGPLTYAANFDQYEFVPFWEALDLISINAYFPLRRHLLPDADPERLRQVLEAGWLGHLRAIDAFRREQGVPDHRVLFTEIGYVSRVNSTIEPWAAHGFSVLPTVDGTRLVLWAEQPTDFEERAQAMRALYNAHQDLGGGMLNGLLYWKLSSVPSHADVEPFVLLIGDQAPPDPLLDELLRFVGN